jgi:hypothetical protein
MTLNTPGERARVSRAETTQRTQRLYAKLPEVKAKREQEEKEALAKKVSEKLRFIFTRVI